MNRHIVVLAEEKKTIESLLTRAVSDKRDNENLEELLIARTEAELWAQLHDAVSILLLSSTFSEASHTDFLKKVLDTFPAIRVISLHHRYGDRSALKVGGFAVIDKPVRNPVLWAKIDEAIADIESDWEQEDISPAVESHEPHDEEEKETVIHFELDEEEEEISHDERMSENTEHMFHVKQEDEVDKSVPPQEETPYIPVYGEKPAPPASPPASDLLFDEEEDDDDDLFGDEITPTYQEPAPAIPSPSTEFVVTEDESEEVSVLDKPVSIPQYSYKADGYEKPETETSADVEETVFSIDEDGDADSEDIKHPSESLPLVDKEEDEMVFSIEEEQSPEPELYTDVKSEEQDDEASFDFPSIVSDEEEEPESPEAIEPFDIEEDEVEEHYPKPMVPDVQEETIPIRPPRRVVRRTSNDLEHENEILPESEVYDEKSEWTKADEGFTAKNGDFVSLAPPRPNRRKSSETGVGKGVSKTDSSESGGLFGSVKSLFKK